MYKKAWCACKVVVLLIWAIAFFCRSRCCSRHLRCLSSLLQPYLRLSLRRRNRTNSRLKNLTGHFILAEPFNIFALGSHKTDEPAWILTLAFFSSCSFTICPCTERYFSKSEWRLPTELPRIQETTSHSVPVKYSTVPAKNLTYILAVNFFEQLGV